MADTYIQMFHEQFYPEIFGETAQKCIQQFTEQKEKIAEDWKNELKRYMTELAQKQKEEKTEAVAEMDISFLYTSLNKKPVFRVDSYSEEGRAFSESLLTGYVKADWMVFGLGEMENRLLEKAKEEKLQRYIRPAEVETLKLRAVRSLLYYFALRFKYMVPEFLDMKCVAKVKKAPSFMLQIGEYMDWQKTLYAILPEVDIFNCDKKTDLKFRSFPAIFYQEKQFRMLDLTQSKFQDCTFTESGIADTKMNDCTFDACLFENVKVIDTQMKGSLFIRCTFRNVRFKNVSFMEAETKEEELSYFEPAEFYECEFADCQFEKCMLKGCFTTNCDAFQLELTDCITANSGFLKMKGITWGNSGQEGTDGIF